MSVISPTPTIDPAVAEAQKSRQIAANAEVKKQKDQLVADSTSSQKYGLRALIGGGGRGGFSENA